MWRTDAPGTCNMRSQLCGKFFSSWPQRKNFIVPLTLCCPDHEAYAPYRSSNRWYTRKASQTKNEASVSLQFHNDSSGPGIRQANSSYPYFWTVFGADGQCIVSRKDSVWSEGHFHLHHVILKLWTTEKCGLTRSKATSCCRCQHRPSKYKAWWVARSVTTALVIFCKSARHRVYGVV